MNKKTLYAAVQPVSLPPEELPSTAERSVSRELTQLNHKLTEIYEAVSNLHRRLEPVMRATPNPTNSGNPREPKECALSEALSIQSEKCSDILEQLNRIHQSLEV